MRANGIPEQLRSRLGNEGRTQVSSAFAPAGSQRSTTMTYAFYGRVSTDDAQDPSLSIPRQLGACEHAIRPTGGEVVAHYWDIESGRKDLARRGNGADPTGFGVPVPRDGGLGEMLRSAANGRPFEAVIVESIDRLSRTTADGTRIERDLELLDISLFAADEPMTASATAILTRRVKQGVAEWYVRDLIEKSRRGMEESVRQGWHTGGPVPYGYMLEAHQHPNPHKAREGKKKHRLVPDPVRAPIVLMAFEDYCLRGMGLGEICDKLNADLDRYPPPKRNRKDEMALRQTWSRSQLQAMLRNPKYTGYNVWGRHDKRPGRPFQRPREQWVWSAVAVHDPIVPKELFDAVEERARRNEIQITDAPAAYPQRRARRDGRLYVLRGRVRCAMCGRRMEGTHQRHANWYRCRFEANRGAVAATVAGHPTALQIKEERIVEALIEFMGRRLFGPDRLRLLRDDLARSVADSLREHDADLARLRVERDDIDRALYRQTLRLEEHDDPGHPVVALATKRIEELSARRTAIDETIRTLDAQRPDGTRPDEIQAMLDAIPDLRPTLRAAARPTSSSTPSTSPRSTTSPTRRSSCARPSRPNSSPKTKNPDRATPGRGYLP
jgi:site-specific DNA recombinase